jgi:signal transduction histidine kinase
MEVIVRTSQGVAEYYYLLHHEDPAGNSVYLFSRHDEAEVDAVFGSFFKSAFIQAFWLTSIIFVALFFLIRWLIRRTTEPLALLSQWATDLANNPGQALNVTFPIEELNLLAAQLRKGVEQTRAHNERERLFLQHASHELRTPLAIIQASLDTLDLQGHASSQPAVQRALRASANMRRLSATLLWLARETGQPADKTRVDLRLLCKKIIDDHRYLVSNRAIRIQTDISPESAEIESDLLAIVIANLVRNAFQYSSEGVLFVNVSACEICVTNPTDSAGNSNDHDVHDSYGLGLQLVQRICRKMEWQFAFEQSAEQVSVIVRWRVQASSR